MWKAQQSPKSEEESDKEQVRLPNICFTNLFAISCFIPSCCSQYPGCK